MYIMSLLKHHLRIPDLLQLDYSPDSRILRLLLRVKLKSRIKLKIEQKHLKRKLQKKLKKSHRLSSQGLPKREIRLRK